MRLPGSPGEVWVIAVDLMFVSAAFLNVCCDALFLTWMHATCRRLHAPLFERKLPLIRAVLPPLFTQCFSGHSEPTLPSSGGGMNSFYWSTLHPSTFGPTVYYSPAPYDKNLIWIRRNSKEIYLHYLISGQKVTLHILRLSLYWRL